MFSDLLSNSYSSCVFSSLDGLQLNVDINSGFPVYTYCRDGQCRIQNYLLRAEAEHTGKTMFELQIMKTQSHSVRNTKYTKSYGMFRVKEQAQVQ